MRFHSLLPKLNKIEFKSTVLFISHQIMKVLANKRKGNPRKKGMRISETTTYSPPMLPSNLDIAAV